MLHSPGHSQGIGNACQCLCQDMTVPDYRESRPITEVAGHDLEFDDRFMSIFWLTCCSCRTVIECDGNKDHTD